MILDPDANKIRALNGKIVFVSGVFDLLHEGHFAFLNKAKELAGEDGLLLVTVHDDKSVSEKKGPDRPFNNLQARMKNLDRLQAVDVVTPWHGWNNIIEFVKELRPEYIAITEGDPYRNEKQQTADGIGAKLVVVTPLLKDFSTTKIIQNLKKNGNLQ